MKWILPDRTKIYEALGAVADGRVEISDDGAKCYSSSRNKFYTITYDTDSNSIMSNDNSSYWKAYLGYPAIAYLLKIGVLEYKNDLGDLLKGIAWKDANQKFKNDFDKALEFVLAENVDKSKHGELEMYVDSLLKDIEKLDLSMLGKRVLPPKGY